MPFASCCVTSRGRVIQQTTSSSCIASSLLAWNMRGKGIVPVSDGQKARSAPQVKRKSRKQGRQVAQWVFGHFLKPLDE